MPHQPATEIGEPDMSVKRLAASFFLLSSFFLLAGPAAIASADADVEVCYGVSVQVNDTAVSDSDCISN